jgi:hypothetical protein
MQSLKKILELIKKTGDRFIFEDEENNLYIVLGLADYENLIWKHSDVRELTEEELLNKINKDIALWKASQEEKNIINFEDFDEDKDSLEEDNYYLEPVETDD